MPSQAPVESHTTATSTGGTLRCLNRVRGTLRRLNRVRGTLRRSNREHRPVTKYGPMVSN